MNEPSVMSQFALRTASACARVMARLSPAQERGSTHGSDADRNCQWYDVDRWRPTTEAIMPDPNFILLYVDSPTASARFYADVIGKPPVESSPTFAMFALESGVMLGLW